LIFSGTVAEEKSSHVCVVRDGAWRLDYYLSYYVAHGKKLPRKIEKILVQKRKQLNAISADD
jgi:hypothetical protein